MLEVEQYDDQKIQDVIDRCEARQWQKGEAISLSDSEKYSVLAAMRIADYTIRGVSTSKPKEDSILTNKKRRSPGCLGLVTKGFSRYDFVDYIQPALSEPLDETNEVKLWLMVYPFESLIKKMQRTGPTMEYKVPQQEFDDMLGFIYDHLYPSAYVAEYEYGTAAETGLAGYKEYVADVRRRVRRELGTAPIFLASERLLSPVARKLIIRYGPLLRSSGTRL